MTTSKQDQPLQFFGIDSQTNRILNAKDREINPLKLIPQQDTNQPQQNEQIRGQFTGSFLQDHILAPSDGTKTYKIKKNDKRLNFKTKMCPYGRDCKRQFTCTFAHTENQLRKPFIKRTKPCILYQKGLCQLGSVCRDYHGNMDLKKKNYKYKTQFCKDYLQGQCPLGNVCIYIHELPPELEQERQRNMQMIQEQNMRLQKQNQYRMAMQKSVVTTDKQVKQEKIKIQQVVTQVLQKKEELVEGGLQFNFSFNF